MTKAKKELIKNECDLAPLKQQPIASARSAQESTEESHLAVIFLGMSNYFLYADIFH